MGGQKKRDTLAEMPRFGGRNVQEGEVFPVWLKELYKKVKFDVGDIGVRIIKDEDEVEEDADKEQRMLMR